jgi:drug/metabolite transporter (DMT)-like permease
VIVAFVLLSALLHATWNALLRLEKTKDQSLVVAIVIATTFAAGIAAVRWWLGEVPFAAWSGVGYTVLAGVFEATYFATLARAMELGKLGVVYTISRGGAVLAVWPLSIALFGEVATGPAMAGSALVLAGLALSGFGAGGDKRGNQPGAVAWASACAMSIAGYHLAYKAALLHGANTSACFALSLGTSATINIVRMGATGNAGIGALVRGRWPRLLMMGLVCGSSFLILMEALARGGSGFVLTLRNTSVLFAIGLARMIGDRPRPFELVGAAAVAAGAALIAWQ